MEFSVAATAWHASARYSSLPGSMADPDLNDLARLGKAIRRMRRYRDLSQEDLADLADFNHRHLSEIERGRRDPRWSTLVAASRAMGVPVSAIVRAYEEDGGSR